MAKPHQKFTVYFEGTSGNDTSAEITKLPLKESKLVSRNTKTKKKRRTQWAEILRCGTMLYCIWGLKHAQNE